MKLIWSPEARVDLREIVIYLADKNPYAARNLHERIEDAATMLIDTPYIGRPGRVPGTREWVIAETSCILPYQIQPDRVEILRIYHSARHWPKTFE
ncbi:MAG: type II toxin-antitoxin system RelE/ParE family toxin [gamma proteobacterium symbiont of Bathyaustriella thionipta]|nr:type II toxin-antitoxin system RelE/ParE family toxin [gamma proteobacterium symbiont of Bathyaustriella thionipta]